MDKVKNIIGYDIDDVLGLIGLERRRPLVAGFLPAIGFLFLGAAIGAGVGLMLAPSSGRRLRRDVGDRIGDIKERMKTEGFKAGIKAGVKAGADAASTTLSHT